jgi:tetratricopeptide (TPR) repeat protein
LSHLSRALALLALVAAAPARPAPPAASPPASAAAIADYLRARLAEGAGDHDGALEALRRALVHDPLSPQLHITYGEALGRAGDLQAAEAEARRALELAPSGPAAADAHLALGRTLALTHRAAEASRELEQAARIEGALARAAAPEARELDPEPWRELARLRLDGGDEAGAAQACAELAALDPQEGAATYRDLAGRRLDARDPEGARRLLERAMKLAPGDPETLKLLARVEESRGHEAEARAAWERALAADPDDPDALFAAGQLALKKGDLGAARGWLRQLLLVAPDEAEVRARVAALWLEARQAADALDAVGGGEDPRLAFLRGLALQQLRRWGEAASAFAEVPATAADLYPSARAALGYALGRAGRPAEAVRALKRGLAAQPQDPTMLYALGEAYDRAGQRDAALAQMRAVLAVKADHAEALNFLGYAYAERGERLDEAQRYIERALAVEPENGYYLDSLGWVLFKKGDYPRAVSALEKADRLAGPEATILDHLGDAYRRARRPADAARAWQRALTAPDPDDERTQATRRAGLQRKLRELGPGEARTVQSRR